MKRYILFHNKRHLKEMGPAEIESFLSPPAMAGNVSAATQNQVSNAILFLTRHVLEISLEGQRIDAVRAQKKRFIEDQREDGSLSLREDARVRGRS